MPVPDPEAARKRIILKGDVPSLSTCPPAAASIPAASMASTAAPRRSPRSAKSSPATTSPATCVRCSLPLSRKPWRSRIALGVRLLRRSKPNRCRGEIRYQRPSRVTADQG